MSFVRTFVYLLVKHNTLNHKGSQSTTQRITKERSQKKISIALRAGLSLLKGANQREACDDQSAAFTSLNI